MGAVQWLRAWSVPCLRPITRHLSVCSSTRRGARGPMFRRAPKRDLLLLQRDHRISRPDPITSLVTTVHSNPVLEQAFFVGAILYAGALPRIVRFIIHCVIRSSRAAS